MKAKEYKMNDCNGHRFGEPVRRVYELTDCDGCELRAPSATSMRERLSRLGVAELKSWLPGLCEDLVRCRQLSDEQCDELLVLVGLLGFLSGGCGRSIKCNYETAPKHQHWLGQGEVRQVADAEGGAA